MNIKEYNKKARATILTLLVVVLAGTAIIYLLEILSMRVPVILPMGLIALVVYISSFLIIKINKNKNESVQ